MKMDSKYTLIAAFIFGLAVAVCAQSDISADDVKKFLEEKANGTEVQAAKDLYKEKCEKNGGAEAYDKAQRALEVLPNCLKKNLELDGEKWMDNIQQEIKDAEPQGSVDEVFKKYCQKTPQAKKCIQTYIDEVQVCFTGEEQKNLKVLYNITEQLAEFVCFKEGDRIALFIAESGPQCLTNKTEEIQDCVQTTFNYEINTENITANVLPDFKFGVKECNQLSDLQKCVVQVLEGCEAPTTANIVESLFKFARRVTPCKPVASAPDVKPSSRVQGDGKPGAATSISVAASAIIFAVVAALY